MKPGPRALYVELKRRFNGSNNGDIILSHRDAATALNVHRNTATRYFSELFDRGFIRVTESHHLGPSGIGQASKWALEELPTKDRAPAGKAFIRWKANAEPPPKKQDAPSQNTGHPKAEIIELPPNRPKKRDAFG